MKVDKYYDITCQKCTKHRSTDFECGLWTGSPDRLRKQARKEGWTENCMGEAFCPECSEWK